MARIARTIAVGYAHHITQWGNNHENVFFTDADRRLYLQILQEQADRSGLEIIGYCLMSNHVHIVAVPHREDSLAKAIGGTHLRYTQYINDVHKRSGHLWQGRFASCALDKHRLWLAVKYVELNPVRARLCRKPWLYAWSSAAAHVDEKAKSDLLNLKHWYDRVSAEQWRLQLAEGIDEAQVEALRVRTRTGRPLGSDKFLTQIETLLGRRVRARPAGRPRKDQGEAKHRMKSPKRRSK